MGFYDRDYYREERTGFSLRPPQTVVVALIIINVAVWAVDGLLMPRTHWLVANMEVSVDTLTQPWLWWQYVTYAFAHSPYSFGHILFNMLTLFILGRDVEAAYGKREFLRFYLVTAVVAAVVWTLVNKVSGTPSGGMFGASGAVVGVVILYALNFPHRTLLFLFVIPVPAWFVGVFLVGCDLYGAIHDAGGAVGSGDAPRIAYAVHLAGAAFALIYYRRQWNLTRLTDNFTVWLKSWSRPKLRIHRPKEEARRPEEQHVDLREEVDRILEKIYREGEASLTAKERRTLETASREFQRKGSTGGGRTKP